MSAEEVWGRLKDPYYGRISNTESLIAHINRSKKKDRLTTSLSMYIVELSNQIYKTRKLNETQYIEEEMIQEAYRQLLVSYKHFDSTKSNNPYGYFVTVITNAFVNYISKEKKQEQIKEYLEEEILLAIEE